MFITFFQVFWKIWSWSALPKFTDLKIGQNSIRIFPYLDRIPSLSIWEEMQIRFCPYMGKYRSENARVSAKFTQWNTLHKAPCEITFPWRTFWIGLVRLVSKKAGFISYIICTRSKINLRIPEPVLESKGICVIFQKKGKKVENLGKNDQNLKIFWKRAASCVRLLHAWIS